MGAGASAESGAVLAEAGEEVTKEATERAVVDAVASLPDLQQGAAREMFSKAADVMASAQLAAAAKEVLDTAGSIDAGEGGQAAVAAVGAAISTAARMAPEVTAMVGNVLLGIAEHLVRRVVVRRNPSLNDARWIIIIIIIIMPS